MISFDLCCGKGHRFEGWFASSHDYDEQQERNLLLCPTCNNADVIKMLSAPNIGRKGNQSPAPKAASSEQETASTNQIEVANTAPMPAAMIEIMQKMASVQTEMLKNSDWVGRQFAEEARAIHYGETDDRLIHGETSPAEAEALAEEGIAVAALPFPVIPPQAKN
jgi:hypothetical protein